MRAVRHQLDGLALVEHERVVRERIEIVGEEREDRAEARACV